MVSGLELRPWDDSLNCSRMHIFIKCPVLTLLTLRASQTAGFNTLSPPMLSHSAVCGGLCGAGVDSSSSQSTKMDSSAL